MPSSYVKAYPDWISADLKAKPNIWRLDPNRSGFDDRFYIEWHEDKPSTIYLSLTSAINALVAKGYGFYKWVASTGPQSQAIKESTAIFGTVFHSEAFKPLVSQTGYDIGALNEIVDPVMGWDNFNMLFPYEYRDQSKSWKYGFMVGLLAFWQFINEKVVKIYAVELPLVSRKWNYAGTLDLVAVVKFGKKEVLAITDVKSKISYAYSRAGETKAYYPEHRAQLAMQKKLLVENYPKLVKRHGGEDAIMLFNWNPVNWKLTLKEDEDGERKLSGGPAYDLVNHTGDKNEFETMLPFPGRRGQAKMIDLLLATLPAHKASKPNTQVTEFNGSFPNVDLFDWTQLVQVLDI